MSEFIMFFLSILFLAGSAVAQRLNFTMSVSPPPQPGSPFLITWTPPPPQYTQSMEILLNNFDPDYPTLPIITTSEILAFVPDNGSWTWNVPSTLCGRLSFGLAFDSFYPLAYGEPWSIPCPPAPSITVYQTTGCITTSTPTPTGANPFIVPNTDGYLFRARKSTKILWTPTTPGEISLLLRNGSNTKTIASNIPNSGNHSWAPHSSLINAVSDTDIYTAAPYTLELVSNSSSTTSPGIYVLAPEFPTWFININAWNLPTVGQPTTIQWSPSNQTSIDLQLSFGAGAVPGPSNTIIIASKIPNTGSWTWNVPGNFTPGEYVLAGLDGDSESWDSNLVTIIVGAVPAGACGS